MPRKKKPWHQREAMGSMWIKKTNKRKIKAMMDKKEKKVDRQVTYDEIITDLLEAKKK